MCTTNIQNKYMDRIYYKLHKLCWNPQNYPGNSSQASHENIHNYKEQSDYRNQKHSSFEDFSLLPLNEQRMSYSHFVRNSQRLFH